MTLGLSQSVLKEGSGREKRAGQIGRLTAQSAYYMNGTSHSPHAQSDCLQGPYREKRTERERDHQTDGKTDSRPESNMGNIHVIYHSLGQHGDVH